MSTEFKPKITYRMAAMNIDNDIASMYPAMMKAMANLPTSPWKYVENWAMSDRGPDETLAKLNERMQNRWPGKYKIVVIETHVDGHMYKFPKWVFKFDSPKDETWFRIQYG